VPSEHRLAPLDRRSSLARPPEGWPGVVVSHLRPIRRILWRDAADVEAPPIAFPHHARQKALALEQRRTAGLPGAIIFRARWPLPVGACSASKRQLSGQH
jgi:hypothetical protein